MIDLDEIERRGLGCLVPKPGVDMPSHHEMSVCDCEVLELVAEIKRLRADAKNELKKEGWLSDPESQSYFAEECVKDLKEASEELKRTRELLEEVTDAASDFFNGTEDDRGHEPEWKHLSGVLAKLRSVSPQGAKE